MKTILNNGIINAMFDSVGAEMWSLSCGNINRIWYADKSVWGKHSPLLFPFVGRLLNGEYCLNGETIKASVHGFCRERKFEIAELTDTRVRYTTHEDEDTLKVWPFSFRLDIEYELSGSTLIKRHIVTNLSDSVMPFEIGGHDAYSVAMLPGETVEDYAIEFEGIDKLKPFGMDPASGMLLLPKSEIGLENGLLKKLPHQVGLDTIVLEDLPVRKAKLIGLKSGLSTEVCFDDFAYLGIWTMPVDEVRYICIEPWTTLPDGMFMSRDIMQRPGICTLQPGESRTYTYTETFK